MHSYLFVQLYPYFNISDQIPIFVNCIMNLLYCAQSLWFLILDCVQAYRSSLYFEFSYIWHLCLGSFVASPDVMLLVPYAWERFFFLRSVRVMLMDDCVFLWSGTQGISLWQSTSGAWWRTIDLLLTDCWYFCVRLFMVFYVCFWIWKV